MTEQDIQLKERQKANSLASKVLKWIWEHKPLAVGLIYFVILAPLALSVHRVGNYGVETDFFWNYAPQAKLLLQDGTLTIDDFRGPLYPITLAGFSFVFGDFFRAGIIISLLSGAFALGLLYAIVARLWNRRMAQWTVVLTAVNPVFVFYSYQAGTDMLYVALAFTGAYFILLDRGIRGGLLGGLAYLTRYTGISLLAAAILSRKRWWILGAFALTILPWGLKCLAEKGDFFYNKNYLNFAANVYAEGINSDWDAFWWNPETAKRYTSFYSVVKDDPVQAAGKVFSNIWIHFEEDALEGIGIPLALLALCGLVAVRPNRKQLQFLLFGAALFAVTLLTYYQDRYSLFLLPFYALLAVLGWQWLWEKLTRFIKGPIFEYLPLALIALILFVRTFAHGYEFEKDYAAQEVPVVAAELAGKVQPGTIAARKANIVWYLNSHYPHYPTFQLLALPKKDVLDELRRQKADYLYLGPSEWYTRPELRKLWNPENAPPDFKLVYFSQSRYVTVYQIIHTADKTP